MMEAVMVHCLPSASTSFLSSSSPSSFSFSSHSSSSSQQGLRLRLHLRPRCPNFLPFHRQRVLIARASNAALRPSPAEAARTLVDVCSEGTLCTSSLPDAWPFGSAVRFAIEPQDACPFFRLPPSSPHTRDLQADSRCSLHIQMEQPGHRKPQCTFKGRVSRVDNETLKEKLQVVWERRFGEELRKEDCFHLMTIESVIQSLDFGEEDVWVSSSDYKEAMADPLRECASKIVEDMNRNHWEDVRRFCNVYAHLDLAVEEAHITWVDRLGFDMRVLTDSHEIMEIRIPFSREIMDERDARSSLTMMAQVAWEYERNYKPPEIQMVVS